MTYTYPTSADSRPTAWCPHCQQIQPIVEAMCKGTESHLYMEGKIFAVPIPPFARLVEVVFGCGHPRNLVMTVRNIGAVWSATGRLNKNRKRWLEDQLEEIVA